MCRWLAYSGAPIYLDELIFQTEHSLIDQSLAARRGETTTNGDGFGIGWYGQRDLPGLYREVRPAWNNLNLRDLTRQIRSSLFLAHVRSATGTAVQQSNCHPFRHGRWLFVHNGSIKQFDRVRRDLTCAVAPELFPLIGGTTDSELMFYLALTFGLEDEPVAAIERMVGAVERCAAERGVDLPLQMTLGLSDGVHLYSFRYSSQGRSPTLFHSHKIDALLALNPYFERFSPDACAVVSEPLSELTDFWVEIPESTVVTIAGSEIEHQPFNPR